MVIDFKVAHPAKAANPILEVVVGIVTIAEDRQFVQFVQINPVVALVNIVIRRQ